MLADEARYKKMVEKLVIEFNGGRMKDTEFINSFMPRICKKAKSGSPLSDREKEVVEKLFEQY
jgi:hypothetical protein